MARDDDFRLSRDDEARWWRLRGERELRQILFWRWDPIGVHNDLPYTEGEYDSYAPRIVAALQRGAGADQIDALLAGIEDVEISVGSSSRTAVSRLIVAWYENSRHYWVEFERDD